MIKGKRTWVKERGMEKRERAGSECEAMQAHARQAAAAAVAKQQQKVRAAHTQISKVPAVDRLLARSRQPQKRRP